MKKLMIIINKKNITRFTCMLVMLMTLTSCNKLFVKAKSLLVELDPTSTTPNDNNNPTTSGPMLSALTEGYCFLKSDSEQYCWGSLFTNQPVNHAPNLKTAYQPLVGKTITNIISQFDGGLKCTIPNDGIPACWGSNYYGQIGNGESGNAVLVPTTPDLTGVLNGKTVKEIVIGNSSTCVIASDDQVYCWGENGYGQLGNGSTTDSYTPVAVSTAGVLNGLTIKKLKSAADTTCVIASDDKLYCWGYGRFGALANGSTANSTIPIAVAGGALGAKTIKQLDMSDNTTCVIASDDKMYCWGYGVYGTLGNGASSNSSSTVGVDFTGVLSGKTITQVHMAGLFTCVIADARVYCWGYGGDGSLGNGSTSNTNVPGPVNTAGVLSGKTIAKMAGTSSTMCALTSDGLVACWGYGYHGELGDGTASGNSLLPVAIDTSGAINGKTITDLTSSKDNMCAYTSDGLVYCWGEGFFGNKLSQNTNEVSVPTSPDMTEALSGKTILEFGAGAYTSCALASDQQIYCWGDGSAGELGNGTDTFTNYPVSLKTTESSDELILDAKYLTYIEGSVCAQRSDGELFCGVTGKSLNFVYDFGNEEIVNLKLKDDNLSFKCALTDAGNLYCWGEAGDGVLGNGTSDDFGIPTLIKMSGALLGKTIKSFEVGKNFVCAIASDDLAYCWGNGSSGHLGGNTGTDSLEPIPVDRTGVLSGKKINSLTIYSETVCAIADDLKAYCWGRGFDGQLGDGVTPVSDVPVAVSTAGVLNNKTIKKISIMETMVCAIANDDLMYCWGNNDYGQLGDGTINFAPVPVAVDMSGVLSGKTIKDFSSNAYSTCAIASDDKVYCWGYGDDGSLGDGNSVDSLLPVAVNSAGALSGKKVVDIQSSYASFCAMDDNEELYCWGDSATGEVGTGLNSVSAVPVKLNL